MTSNHLKEYNHFNLEITKNSANCTTYMIKQTQGAEYGDEAEAIRQIFEAAFK